METNQKPIVVQLVDSQQIVLFGIAQLLEQDPRFTLSNASTNGQAALKAAIEHQPDIIILEPELPEEDGMELINELRIQSNANILVYSGSRNALLLDQAVVKGVRGVLSKTEPTEILLKAIEKVHEGELWLNRNATSRILQQASEVFSPKELDHAQVKLNTLTPKEKKITRAIQLHTNITLKEIATTLHISEHTLRNHLVSIYDKIGVRNRMELYLFCGKHLKTEDPLNHPKRRASAA